MSGQLFQIGILWRVRQFAKIYVKHLESDLKESNLTIRKIKQITGYTFKASDLNDLEKLKLLSSVIEGGIQHEIRKQKYKASDSYRLINLYHLKKQIKKKRAEMVISHALIDYI